MAHALLQEAVYKNPLASWDGLLERLFTVWFHRFVYNQIWEDPRVDLAAMELAPGMRVATIASGGCNVLNYLTAQPVHITAVDLNPNHAHLTRLKCAAAQHMPDHHAFYAMFGLGSDRSNLTAYERFLQPYLPAETRDYWEGPDLFGRRKLDIFRKGLYRHSLLGRFIDTLHWLGRRIGCDPSRLMTATSVEEQRRLFDAHVAPAFDAAVVRWIGRLPFVLYSLGIPPSQFAVLRRECDGNLAALCRERVRRLACDFPLADNYFAWQAFGRRYDHIGGRAVPDYLRAEHFEALRERARRVETRLISMTDMLRQRPPQSFDRYVLLDAQDWMDAAQLTALWEQIARTARPGARVIFRTAGAESPVEAALPEALRARFVYEAERSRALGAQDRSAIYGGFHLYRLAEGPA